MIVAAATNNAKKLKEIQRILDTFGWQCKSLKELDIEVEIEESGETFEDNAVIKAKTIAQMSGMPAISDDSGLEVKALCGKPGVYTARYAGENATDDENIDKLLGDMKDIPHTDRQASFVSAVCLCLPNGEYIVCTGECGGEIATERVGSGGFGYDPIFMVGKKSYAQMSSKEKDAISHRGKALKELQTKIKEYTK